MEFKLIEMEIGMKENSEMIKGMVSEFKNSLMEINISEIGNKVLNMEKGLNIVSSPSKLIKETFKMAERAETEN